MSRKTNTTAVDINPGYLLNHAHRNKQESVVIPALSVGASKKDRLHPTTDDIGEAGACHRHFPSDGASESNQCWATPSNSTPAETLGLL